MKECQNPILAFFKHPVVEISEIVDVSEIVEISLIV